ncbi:MAG: nicotinamide mononucleotide transporter [Dehalococcoidales bacterium]|nr:nicotinamide mononucleotide transporter [Dehalococcoidales bacterium]
MGSLKAMDAPELVAALVEGWNFKMTILWILTGLSILGTVLNIYKRQECFVLWLITNSIWCLHNIKRADFPQAALFAVYVVFAVWGLLKWAREKRLAGKSEVDHWEV